VSIASNAFKAATYNATLQYFPWVAWLLHYAVPKIVMEQQRKHWELSMEKINRRLNMEKNRADLISLIRTDEEGQAGLTLSELKATASLMIMAGSETSISVLCGTTNYLIKTPHALNTLVTEIRESFLHPNQISLALLKELPYLNAVIQEGLRLCNPT
jgi:cytochrome P450